MSKPSRKKTATIAPSSDHLEEMARQENLKRLNDELYKLLEKEKIVQGKLMEDRLAVVTESRWKQLWNMVRDKICPQRKNAEELYLQTLKNSGQNDVAVAEHKKWEAHCKSRKFIALVDKGVDTLIGIRHDPRHQALVNEKNDIQTNIEKIQEAINAFENKQKSAYQMQINGVSYVAAPSTIIDVVQSGIEKLRYEQYENQIEYSIKSKQFKEGEYLKADHNLLYEKALNSLYPQHKEINTKLSDLAENNNTFINRINEASERGIQKGFTTNGTVNKFWPPKLFKKADRLQWEAEITNMQMQHQNIKKQLASTAAQFDKINREVKSNDSKIRLYMKDTFEPDYSSSKELVDLKLQAKQIVKDLHASAKIILDMKQPNNKPVYELPTVDFKGILSVKNKLAPEKTASRVHGANHEHI